MSTSLSISSAFPLFDVIEETVSKGDQDVHYLLIGNMDGNKVRVMIRSNSYDFQSHAKAEVWSKTDMRWNPVTHRPFGAMQTPFKLCYNKDNWNRVDHFREDCRYLLGQVAAIIL